MIARLEDHGIDSVEIGPAHLEDELWIVSERGVRDVGGALSPACREVLRHRGYAVQWYEYPMQHEVSPDELVLIGEWLQKVLG